MAYTIRIARDARKELEPLPQHLAERVLEKILALAENPRPAGCTKLKGHARRWRLRVGDYRVLYDLEEAAGVVEVLHIRHRREAYRDQ